jgi:hypothetical protein
MFRTWISCITFRESTSHFVCHIHLLASKFCMCIRGLRSNNLQGSLSPDMCQLTGLWYLWVHHYLPPIFNVALQFLDYVHKAFIIHLSDVKNNSMMGTIPDTIGNCTSFQVLYVYTFFSFWIMMLILYLVEREHDWPFNFSGIYQTISLLEKSRLILVSCKWQHCMWQ